MANEIKVNANDLRILISEVKMLREALLHDGELTSWAQSQLKKSRKISDSNYISLDELEKGILKK